MRVTESWPIACGKDWQCFGASGRRKNRRRRVKYETVEHNQGGLPQHSLKQGIEELDRIEEAVTGLGEVQDDLPEALDRLRETFGGASQ